MRLRPSPTPSLALAAVLLGGCGGSSPRGIAAEAPTQILASARAAAEGAATVHIEGSILANGKPLSIDMELLRERGARGQIAVEGLEIDLIRLDQILYIHGSAAFYRRLAGPTAARLLRGRWLKAPPNAGNFSSFSSLTDLRRLIDTTLDAHGTLARGAISTVDGQRAVAINDISAGGTLYVAASGPPYPLVILRRGGGRVIFEGWNKPVTLTPPASSININALRPPK